MVGILHRHFKDYSDPFQACADALHKAVNANLIKWGIRTDKFVVNFDIPEDVQQELDQYQYPLPCVVLPQHVRTNRDTGMFRSRGSIILKDNHHEEDVCLDHINRMNRIKFSLDFETAIMVQNSWRNLDKPKAGEEKGEYEKRVRAFDKYDRSSREVMAKLIMADNEFYLTHKFDKRGRIYSQGYHVNYQGNPWNKAVIELADKEHVL